MLAGDGTRLPSVVFYGRQLQLTRKSHTEKAWSILTIVHRGQKSKNLALLFFLRQTTSVNGVSENVLLIAGITVVTWHLLWWSDQVQNWSIQMTWNY